MNTYGHSKKVSTSFPETVAAVKETLQQQGLGVLSEIDVKVTLKQKLDKDTDPYIILGACNPQYAHKALEMEKELGLLLPCNVIVYESNESVYAAAIDLVALLGITGNDALLDIAEEVKQRLEAAIDSLS
jgi:uncharacterized protein (DUF302 family)